MLAEDMAGFFADPLGYVRYNWAWGTGLLADYTGPREWQEGFLREWGEEIAKRGFDGVNPVEPLQDATSSGHGIGKSALTAWAIKFIHDTRPFSKGIVTANTGDQLRTKTWSELGKWHNLSLTEHWSELNSGKGSMSLTNKSHPQTWRVDAQTCREENSEAFAGLHAANSTPFYIFDEASAVPDKIWEVASGGLTDGEPMWFVFGNPTRNTGRFRECFGRLRHRWASRQIDSRDVEGTNKALFKTWVEDFGEESDYVKVRVRGQFPSASSLQFIPSGYVEAARTNEVPDTRADGLVVGVDVARFGDDETVIRFRRGLDARCYKAVKLRGVDTMQLASTVTEIARGSHYTNGAIPDLICIDEGGVGGGVVDRVRMLGVTVVGVQFGSKPSGVINNTESAGERYANKRAEMYGLTRAWLKRGGCIDDDQKLYDDLVNLEYSFNEKDQILLEKKSAMKARGLASCDDSDALAITFAAPCIPRGMGYETNNKAVTDYDPYED